MSIISNIPFDAVKNRTFNCYYLLLSFKINFSTFMRFDIQKHIALIGVILFVLTANAQSIDKEDWINNNNINIIDLTGISNKDNTQVAFGKRNLIRAIQRSGGQINDIRYTHETVQKGSLLIGTLDNQTVAEFVADTPDIKPNKPEGIFYQWRKTKSGAVLIIGGTDPKGLMYGLNELAQHIEDRGLAALKDIQNSVEFPVNQLRGVDKFLTDEHDGSWFFSEAYWHYYIGQLSKNRFNRLTLITGYNDGKQQDFMIPVYPYLYEVSGYENVSLKKHYKKSPTEYVSQLRKIGELCHNYGLEFVFGIWGHGRSDELILGLPEEDVEYTKYCSKGMYELLQRVPEIDGIQLRVNYESGIGGFGNTADNFWKEIIGAIAKSNKEGNKVFLNVRAKGLTDNIREFIEKTNIDFSVTSKYTWEGMGLPYHPTEMRVGELTMLDNVDKRQRYGYADFLKYDREYDFIYRLWGIGTLRMLTWADPDYARRFSASTRFGRAKGFQVTPPMARKQNTWSLIKDLNSVYYKWEDERYWAWYLLFGRLGYSESTPPKVWEREFKLHYGPAFENILKAYESASKILPLITSSHLTFHPANYNWAEIESGGALFVEHNANPFYIEKKRTYQSSEPGDPGLFYSIEQYVEDQINGDIQPKINPIQLSHRFYNLSQETLESLNQVNINDIPRTSKKEFLTNEMDLKILSNLGLYHSFKIKASTDFVFFEKTTNKGYLKSCLINLIKAKAHWTKMIDDLDELYFEKPRFLHDNGTWKDRLVEIEKDIQKLEVLIGQSTALPLSHWDDSDVMEIEALSRFEARVPKTYGRGEDLKVVLKTDVFFESPKEQPKAHYRSANMTSGKFKKMTMKWDGTQYVTIIPSGEIDSNFDLLIYFTQISKNGGVLMNPGLFNDDAELPYYVIKKDNP